MAFFSDPIGYCARICALIAPTAIPDTAMYSASPFDLSDLINYIITPA